MEVEIRTTMRCTLCSNNTSSSVTEYYIAVGTKVSTCMLNYY